MSQFTISERQKTQSYTHTHTFICKSLLDVQTVTEKDKEFSICNKIHVTSKAEQLRCQRERATYIDKFNLPDFFQQVHRCVAIDEKGFGVVPQLDGIQPLSDRGGMVAIMANGSHLQ